jgi:outer membrane protein assembly factor BamB
VHSSPAIGSDGTVYVGSWNNKLYALATSSKGLAKSPWPMRGQNAQHTGRVTNKATEPTETKDFPKEIEGNTLTLQEDDPEVVFKRKVSTKHPAELAHVWVPGPFAGTDQVLILSKEGKLTINPRKGLTIKGIWGVPQGVAGNQVILTFDHPETGREHVLKYEYMLGEQEIQDLSGKTTGKEVVLYLKGIGNNKDETEYVRPVK